MLQRVPFFRLLLALCIGIILYQFIHLSAVILTVALFISATVTASIYISKSTKYRHQHGWLSGLGLFLFIATIGYGLCKYFDHSHAFSDINQKGIFQAEVISSPIEKPKSYQCKIKLLQRFDSLTTQKASGNAIIYFQKDTVVESLHYGDKIIVHAEFKTPDGIQNPNGFDYAHYLKRQGILATAYITTENWSFSKGKTHVSIRRTADFLRERLLNIYRKFKIQGDEFAVLAALTLGYTDELDSALMKSYSATGAMHILSVSGLHVGIVFFVISFLLKFLDKKRGTQIIKSVIIILFLWIYAFVTGLSPAVMRAAFMFSAVSLAQCLNRKSNIYNTIFFSAFIMLIINPNSLFNVGFQLSYAAVISIVFFQPTISKWFFTKNRMVKWIWDLIAVSLAAQLGTAPFVLYYFHQFPNLFLLTNLIAIPLSTLVIYLAIALQFLSFIPYLSHWIAFALKWTVWLMNSLIVWIENLPGAISFISLDYRQLTFSFTALFFIIGYFHNKRFYTLVAGLISVLFVTSGFMLQKYKTISQSKMIIFSDSRVPIVNFIHQGENYVYTTDTLQAEKVAGNFWESNLLSKPIYNPSTKWLNNNIIYWQGKKILILTDNTLKNKVSDTPLAVDYLIISNKVKPKMDQILACVLPETVIVDKSITAWYTNHIEKICKMKNITFYSVAKKGAFVLNFKP